jgi:hypothetical protein
MVDALTGDIVMSVAYSPAPGAHWECEIRMEPTATGHIVRTSSPETGRMRVVRRSRRPLSWRAALDDLQALEEARFAVEEAHLVEVSSLCEWQADMLRMAACRIDVARSAESVLLAQLSDDAIENLARRWGRLVSAKAREVVRALDEIHSDTGALAVIEEWVRSATKEDCDDSEGWLERMRQACQANPGPGPSLAAAKKVTTAAQFLELAQGPPPRDPAVRAVLFRKWVDLLMVEAFNENRRSLGDDPGLRSAEWIVGPCVQAGELAHAAGGDAPLADSLRRFQTAVDKFLGAEPSAPPGANWASGIGQSLRRRALERASVLRDRVCGDANGTAGQLCHGQP